jgi:hypothetical protein
MSNIKSLEFRQSMKEAVKRMSADLEHACHVAHEYKRVDATGEDEDYPTSTALWNSAT